MLYRLSYRGKPLIDLSPCRSGNQQESIQIGTDMLYEMIPAYLEFFGFGAATPEELRAVSQIRPDS